MRPRSRRRSGARNSDSGHRILERSEPKYKQDRTGTSEEKAGWKLCSVQSYD